jgi:hypothetical protein
MGNSQVILEYSFQLMNVSGHMTTEIINHAYPQQLLTISIDTVLT